MNWKRELVKQIADSEDNLVELSITEFSMAVSSLVDIVKTKGKRLIIVNRGKKVAVLRPYHEAQDG